MGSPVRALLLTALTACLATPAAAAQPPAAATRPSTAAPAATTHAAPPAKAGSRSGPRAFVPGRLLVGFAARAGEGGRQAAAAAVDGRVLAGHGRTRVLALDQGADVRAAARRLAARPEVAFAEPDWLRRVDACDPDLCWHLQPDPGADLAAAHDGGATGAGRTVAVVDTGVAAIDDLAGRVVERWRCASTCQLEDPDQPAPLNFDHGTEVASVAAAADDGDGITGAAPEAEVVSYRVDSDSGAIPVSAVNAALQQIAGANLDDGIADVDVVNLSLGGPQWSDAEQDAVDAVLDAGIAVVAAAGNQGNYLPQYPAAYHGVVSVGASTQDGGTASFSSYGKVDVVAPGQDVPVVNPGGKVEHADGTSFAAPIVAGTLALTPAGGVPQNSVPRAKLALEATAHAELPDGIADAKPWAHGLIDGDAFVDAHQAGADTLLAIDADAAGDPPGSGDGQLPHPATSFTAAAFKADGSLAANPGNATFGGAAGDTAAAFAEAGGGVFTAAADSAELDAGTRTATATIQGTGTSASATVRVLRDDDQAPGVALSGAGDEAWRRVDAVQAGSDDDPADDDVDDVYAVVLAAGDTLDAAIARLAGDQVAAVLYTPGTTDVLGQLDRIVACGGGPAVGCSTTGLHFTATAGGTYLLDVYAAGGSPTPGDYRLTWTVRNRAGLPLAVTVAACSPNGDGARDRCAWTAGALSGWTTTSFITKGAELLLQLDGAGARSWDGHDQDLDAQPDGAYTLRVLYLRSSGRALLRTFRLTLDRVRPGIAGATASPNPFEPRPHDGDRDTTTFAMTSTEPGRLRVVVYRYGTTTVLRTMLSGVRPAGRQRLAWSGRSASGAWLRGRVAYTIEAIDPAGNRARSARHRLTIV